MFINRYTWYVIFIPFIFGIIHFRKLNKSHRFLFWFVAAGVLTEITSRTLKKFLLIKNNMPLGHLYISISFLFLSLFYLFELKNTLNKKITALIIILFELFCLFNIIILKNHLSFPNIPGAINALLLTAFAILLFTVIMHETKIKRLADSSLIWINSAVLLYFSSNFFYYTLYNIILSFSRDSSILTINLFAIINVIFYILLTAGLINAVKIKQLQSS